MPVLETHYLIDFENVHEDGLSDSNELGTHDHIHIFSTKNAPKIGLEELEALNSTELFSHIILAGSQSLDMHLVSYLGYLIESNSNKNCKYVIVSKDTDSDNVISFLKEYAPNITISRQAKISTTSHKNSVQKSAVSKSANTINKNKTNPSSEQKVKLNAEIQHSISKAGYAQQTSNKVASIVVKHYGEKSFSVNVHNELGKTYTDFSEIYQIIQPILKRYSSATTKSESVSNSSTNIQSAF